MVDYELLFAQIQIHTRWYRTFDRVEQVTFYHRNATCACCNPPNQNTIQFDHFWNWYSIENLALGYTSCTQQALIDLNSSVTVAETWEAIYSIVFNPLEELYHISETALTTDTDSSTDSFDTPNDFRPLFDEPVGLLFADEDLHLNQFFEEPEVPGMAALGGGFNPNILLNALNNLTNALGAGRNNWANINNAINTLNITLTANNNALQTHGTQTA
ncbi:unnamed protein product [Rhizophagus irregularis]|nr:unnamed protein product [Rhizophagus irregularis]CAB5313798.1 unnamed protein product [Rhizophagus irregularis]